MLFCYKGKATRYIQKSSLTLSIKCLQGIQPVNIVPTVCQASHIQMLGLVLLSLTTQMSSGNAFLQTVIWIDVNHYRLLRGCCIFVDQNPEMS